MSTIVATEQITQAFKQFLNASKDLQIQQALDTSNEWAKFGSNFFSGKLSELSKQSNLPFHNHLIFSQLRTITKQSQQLLLPFQNREEAQ